jgi:hypothetical protein
MPAYFEADSSQVCLKYYVQKDTYYLLSSIICKQTDKWHYLSQTGAFL